jgi:hypothetical protein
MRHKSRSNGLLRLEANQIKIFRLKLTEARHDFHWFFCPCSFPGLGARSAPPRFSRLRFCSAGRISLFQLRFGHRPVLLFSDFVLLGEDSPARVLALDFGSHLLLEVLLRASPSQVFHARASSAPAPSRSGRAAGISSGFHRPTRVYRSAWQGANFRFTADRFPFPACSWFHAVRLPFFVRSSVVWSSPPPGAAKPPVLCCRLI